MFLVGSPDVVLGWAKIEMAVGHEYGLPVGLGLVGFGGDGRGMVTVVVVVLLGASAP